MFIFIIIICLSAIVGATVVYAILAPKARRTQILDIEIETQNEQLRANNIQLKSEYSALVAKTLAQEQHIKDMQKQAEESANAIYETSYQLASEKMSAAALKMSAEYEEARSKMEQEYLQAMASQSAQLSQKLNATNTSIKLAENQLAELTAKVDAAIQAAKRQEELQQKQDFYKLNLTDIDIQEISKLREVTALLRNSEPLNKVIWKVYYEKPYTDLIGRVVGTGIHTGIYKITNIQSQKCYVGQAADIASRWKQHIKRGIGAEAPTRNKLYPAMLTEGVENFTFEIIEECSRAQLNDREDYWQDYFGAKEFGYSIK